MCVVPKRCNDMMNVGRLQGFDVRLAHHTDGFFRNFFPSSINWMRHRDKDPGLLRYFPLCVQGKIVAQGRLLLQDTFMVSDQDSSLLSRARERRVFLFEQIVIFSEPLDKKKGFSTPGYLFKNSIKVIILLFYLLIGVNTVNKYNVKFKMFHFSVRFKTEICSPEILVTPGPHLLLCARSVG